MKQLYRIIIGFLLTVLMVNVAHAQSEDNGIIDRTQIDTCVSFKRGCEYYYRGIYYLSESDLRNAIRCFELHLTEHPQDEYTADYLGYTYYYLYFVYLNKNQTEDVVECFEKALLYLPIDDTIARFNMHYYYSLYLFNGDSLSGIEPDYCEAFDEFNKAMACIDDIELTDDLLPLYKNLYYNHACLLFDAHYYNSNAVPDTITICNEIVERPDWVSCIGEQKLDRCMDDLNHIICIERNDSPKTNIDTLAHVLLGQCYYYCADYEKAIYYYEKSGIAPTQLMAWFNFVTVSCFLDAYFKQGLEDSERVRALSDVLFEFWRCNYRLMYMDKANYKDKQGVWPGLAANVIQYYKEKGEYEKALDFWYKIKNNFSFDDVLLTHQGLCRFALGDTTATEDLEFAARLNPQNAGLSRLGMTLSLLSNGNLYSVPFANQPVLLDGNDSIRSLGLDTTYYLIQGWASYCQKNYGVAKDYYNELVNLDKSSDNWLMLALCFKKLAEDTACLEKAEVYNNKADIYFHKVIEIEDSTFHYSSAPYAYYYLGDPDNAIRTTEFILQTGFPVSTQTANDSLTCFGIHYQAAEIYANVGKRRLAKQHIKKAFEYSHEPLTLSMVQYAPLLAPIKQFVKKETDRYLSKESPIHDTIFVCDIPFKKKGNSNTRTISCTINGVTVDNMLFDPGAEYVQLTKDVVDSIGEDELYYIGWQRTQDANGNPICQRIVSLDTLKIGDIVLENVQATINEEPGAQRLLGCTVWNNIKVEMPSPVNKGMIRLTYIKESIEIPEDKKNTDKQ